jgi:hypothetical protein
MRRADPERRSKIDAVGKPAMVALFLVGGSRVCADSVLLSGGEKLIGKVVSESPTGIVFESQTLGRLEVAVGRIERIQRDTPEISVPLVSTNTMPGTEAWDGSVPTSFLPWTTEPTGSADFDWIQLKSGEWLAGRIKSLQEEKLEFDSEELNQLTFDWKDIRTVHSNRRVSIRFENRKPVDGSLFVTTNEVQVVTDTATNGFPRSELLAITPTGNREMDKWTGKISAGVSFRAGNTREVDVNTQAAVQRRTPDTRIGLDYLGNFGRVNGVETEENHRFSGQFDYFLSRRLYARLPDIEYYRDPLQNLEHRLTIGAGVGHDIIKTARTEWNATISPSWQRNWYSSVQAGENSSPQSLALVLSTRFETELTRRLDFIFEYRGQFTRRDTGNDTHHTVTTLEFDIHKQLKLDLSFIWDRISYPQTESGGTTPTPDDFRLITSLGADF